MTGLKKTLLSSCLVLVTGCKTGEAPSRSSFPSSSPSPSPSPSLPTSSSDAPADAPIDMNPVSSKVAENAPPDVQKKVQQETDPRTKTQKPVQDMAPKARSPLPSTQGVLLRWINDRYSLEQENGESVEKKKRDGRLVCDITEAKVKSVYGENKVRELESAINGLAQFKNYTMRNPIFRAYDESRELLAFHSGEEFMIEMMYQARIVITPGPDGKVQEFENFFDQVWTFARDEKLCPKLEG